jgi:translocation and assembly module TamB
MIRIMIRMLGRVLAFLVVGLVGLLAFIISTESGLRLVWTQAGSFLPGGLEIESLEGRLIGPVSVRGLVFTNASLQLSVREAQLEWSPLRLLRGALHVERLAVDGLSYTALASAPPAEEQPFVLPERIGLPLQVSIDDLRLQDLAFYGAVGAEPFRINTVELTAGFSDEQLGVEHLAIDAPTFDVDGASRLTTRDGYPLEGAYHWQLRLPDYPPIVGDTRLAGTLQVLTVHQVLASPYALEGEVSLSELFDQIRFDAELAVRDLALHAIRPDYPALVLNASLTGKGSLEDLSFSAQTRAQEAAMGTLETRIEGHYRSGTLILDSLRAAVPGQAAQLQAKGQVDLAGPQPALDLQANWTQLRWPLAGEAQVTSARGGLKLAGTLDAFELAGDMQLDAPAYAGADVSFSGRGGPRALQLSRLHLAGLDGEVDGTARASWDPDVQVSLDLQGKDLNPGVLLTDWPGRLGVQMRAEAGLEAGEVNARIHELRGSGTLRDYPLQLSARGSYAARQVDLESLALSSGPSQVEAHGRIGEVLDVTWELDSTDLASLSPAAAGRLSGKGSAQGPLGKPHIKAVVKGSDLRYGADSLTRLALDADVDLAGKTQSVLAFELDDASLADVKVARLAAHGNGTPAAHAFDLRADTSQGTADIRLTGAMRDASWAYRITQATLKYPDLEAWTLKGPAIGEVAREHAELTRSCWVSQAATLCAQADWSPASLETAFTLDTLPAGYFAPLLPPDLQIDTDLSGQGQLTQRADAPLTARLRLTTTPGSLATRVDDEETVRLLEFDSGDVRLDLDSQGMRLSASLPLAAQGLIAMQARVGPGTAPITARPLEGQLTTEVRDVRFVSELTPELSSIQGRLEGTARLSGTLGKPAITGRIALADAAATLDRPGLSLEDLAVELTGRGSGEIALKLQARSGGGTLSMAGTADLAAEPVRADLKITGDQFQVLDTPEAKLFASPDLVVALAGRRVDITGEMRIPRGKIEPKQLPESAVTVSSDQVIIDDVTAEAPPSAPYAVSARVRIILGDQVKFSGFGLKGRFEGNLLVTDKPDKPTTATGELRVLDGTYKAYGQNLAIRTGRLLFAGGPVAEPGLDVEAVRRPATNVLVGVKVRGSLKEPEFSLFSDPAMGQSEQLSYLVLGRPLEKGATTEEKSALNQAAVGLGLAGGALLGEGFGEKLGLDELTVESGPGESTEQASLMVGKYLSPKLYVSYGLGIFEPISTFRVRYILTSSWSVVGETSATQSGADLFYVIERGK